MPKDFAQFLRDEIAHDPALASDLARERLNANLATMIYQARKAAGLTQKQLADLTDTHQSVISRLEDADYDGHSLPTLQRIAAALGMRLHVSLVEPQAGQQPAAAPPLITTNASSEPTALHVMTGEGFAPPYPPITAGSNIATS